MQLTTPRGNFIEKVVRDAQGRLVRATFCVYEVEGHIKARLVSVVFLDELTAIQNKPFLLCSTPSVEHAKEISFRQKIVSIYFNLNLLHIVGSKPRAPTF